MSRRRLLATAGLLAGAAPLPSCSTSVPYDAAVAKTWRRFDGRITEPVALQHELIRYATLAPSSHNTQCWRFRTEKDAIVILPDFGRRCPAVDPDDHHLFVSLGCATENLVQAALANGFRCDVRFDAANGGTVRVGLERGKSRVSPLFSAIERRQCTRALYDGKSLLSSELHALENAGSGTGVHVVLLTDRNHLEQVLEYVVRGNSTQMNDRSFMDELRRWIRFNDRDAMAKGDGLSSRCSGNPQTPTWLGGLALKYAFTAKGENDKYSAFIRSSAGIAVFASEASDKEHWVQAGRCYERFVLAATALGIRTAMVNQPVEVSSLRPQFAHALGIVGSRPDLVVRFGHGKAMPRSLRRPVAAVII